MPVLMALFGILICSIVGAVLIISTLFLIFRLQFRLSSKRNLALLGPEAPLLDMAGLQFRDLNKNGILDIYEDVRRPIEERVDDLLSQMTLEEKGGMLFHPMISSTPDGNLVEQKPDFMSQVPTSELVLGRHITHFNIANSIPVKNMARWTNRIQKMAERTRLGIPVSISSDPRHSKQQNLGAAITTLGYSQWPDPLGLGATRDETLVREFGDVARQEYLATGIRSALHPMADLATEPRWGRMYGTFGEDADLVSRMTIAYIQGFQGQTLGQESVACMIKHFPGGGPQKNGLDAHFPYGREQAYPGENFAYHLRPFEAAFRETDVVQVMPYYGIPVDQTSENVGMAFNKEIINGLLREKYGFEGVICTDWMICETVKLFGLFKIMDSPGWGVEKLTPLERFHKALDAGVDQFGGQMQTHRILELVHTGQVSEARLDASVRRLLKLKFQLGLFDNPYVDEDAAENTCAKSEFVDKARLAQRKSVVLLKNSRNAGNPILPLTGRPKLYVENMGQAVVSRYADIVAQPSEADFAILRLRTPWRPMGKGFMERLFHQGDLDFEIKEKTRILNILRTVPTIVDIYLERAAVIPEIAAGCSALLATFNVADDAVLDIIFGQFNPGGKLPVELPRSMDAVRAQKEDMPYDSKDPLYAFGAGLSYIITSKYRGAF